MSSASSSQSYALSKNAEKLEVTVIPVDDVPYSKIIQIPHSMLGKLTTLLILQATLSTRQLVSQSIVHKVAFQAVCRTGKHLEQALTTIHKHLTRASRICSKRKTLSGSQFSETSLSRTSSHYSAFSGRKSSARWTALRVQTKNWVSCASLTVQAYTSCS